MAGDMVVEGTVVRGSLHRCLKGLVLCWAAVWGLVWSGELQGLGLVLGRGWEREACVVVSCC